MTEKTKAPRKPRAPKVSIGLSELDTHSPTRMPFYSDGPEQAPKRVPKPRSVAPSPEFQAKAKAKAKAKRITALQRAALKATKAASPTYNVRGRLAAWLLTYPSPLALAAGSRTVNGRTLTREQLEGYTLHPFRKRFVRFAG